jgi:hypothetical protein
VLVANKSWVKHNTVGYKFADTSIGCSSFCPGINRLDVIFNLAVSGWRETAAIPTSLMARKAWLPPLVAGGIGSYRKAKVEVGARGAAVIGLPAAGTAALQVHARGAAGVWLSISGTATVQINARGSAGNLLAMSGTAAIAIAGRATATQVQNIAGTATLELAGRAEPTLIMWVKGSTAEQGLTPDGIARTVWEYVNRTLTAGGGGGGLTQQQVRDALKLAASAGTPAAGSVDAKLDDIGNNTGLIPGIM